MSARSVQIQLGLLLVSLVIAWLTFRGELSGDAPREQQGVVLLQAADGDVERVLHEGEQRSLRLEAQRDEAGRWFLGEESVRESDGEPLDGAEDTSGEDISGEDASGEGTSGEDTSGEDISGEDAEEGEIFRGGAAVSSLWEQLEPLRARRILGELTAEKLAELGLDGSERLLVSVRGREHAFFLGNEVFGSSDRYARQGEGRVVVLPGELTRDLEMGPRRLMERRLVAATRPEVELLALSRATRSARIVQRGATLPADAYWTWEGEEEARAELATWVDKLFRLQAVGYRAGDPAPEWRAEAQISVSSREHGSDTLEIWSTAEEGRRVWLARSAFSRLIAELGSLAQEACEDLDSLIP